MWQKRYVETGIVSLFLIAASTSFGAVDVTVNSTQPEVAGSNYQTINAALNFVKTQTAPRTVRITGGGPYLENMILNYSVTIRGDGYRPVIAAPPTTGGPGPSMDGRAIGICTTSEFTGPQNFRLENFILLPAVGATLTRGIYSNNNDGGSLTTDPMNVEVVDVLVTGNNGSNQPISTDGLSQANLTGATTFIDDLIYFQGIVDAACTGTITTNCYNNAASADGFVFFADEAGHTFHMGPGCVASYMDRIGVQVATDGTEVTMIGTADDPIVIKGNHQTAPTPNAALAIYYDDNSLDVGLTMEHVVIVDNNFIGMNCLFSDETDSISRMAIDQLAIVSNDDCGLALSDIMARTWNIVDSTIVNNAIGAGPTFPSAVRLSEEVSGTGTGTVNFTDSIIAGNGTAGDVNTGANHIEINAPNLKVNIVNSGVPTAGPYALAPAKYALFNGAVAPTETNVLTVDPQFVAVNADFANANFLDVQAAAYDNAATGGADLSGYGDWVGGSSVEAWSLY